jgi:hypothetical protein
LRGDAVDSATGSGALLTRLLLRQVDAAVGRRFRIANRTQLFTWLPAYNLGTLISTDADDWPRASASPLVVRPR